MAIKPVEILITAKDKASGILDSLRANAGKVGAAIAGYFGIKLFAGAVQGAAELEAKLSAVQAVSGATASELARLRAAAEEAGSSTKFTATEAADALGNLSRSGLDATQAIEALQPTLALASAGGIDLAESSSLVTKVLAGFGLEAAEAGRIADVLAKGANASNTSVTGLGEALSYASPTAVSLGMSLETVVAIIGKFADAGIDASRAGTALNSILAQFSDPASKFRNELAAAGITTTNFEKALRQLEAAGPAGQKAIAAVGLEAGPALKALLNQGIGSLDELKQKLMEAEGSAQATADTMSNNLAGAVKGLGSAWDTVKNALATPVLPVLKDGVDQLTTALRAAVQDGTVGRFGTAIAAGFQSALTWARSFQAEVDFDALSARVTSAADKVGAAFATLETYAKNTGNSVQLVWGVMSAGANAVLAVVYTVGEAFAGVASNIQSGVALILQGLSKITFGGVAANFKAAAEEMRISAEATWAASEALAQKAGQALAAVADGAEAARSGWAGLTASTEAATAAAATSEKVMQQVSETLKEVGGDATALGQKAQAAAVLQTEAARQAREEVAALKREYEAALTAGDVQTAVAKLQQMQTALRATAGEAKATAAEVSAAFERMGVSTRADLERTAANALRDFKLIKDSGQATTAGLQQAFTRYAEAAIAANGGVASQSLKAEAAMRGLEIVTDATGKTIVRAMAEAREATDGASGAADRAAAGYRGMAQSAEQAAAAARRLAEINAKYASPLDNAPAAPGKAGAAVDNTLIFTLREKLQKGTLTADDAKALQTAIATLRFNEASGDAMKPGAWSLDGINDQNAWKATRTLFEQALARVGGGTQNAPTVGRTVQVNINTPAGRETVNTDEAGAAAVVRALQQAGLSAGR